MNVREVLDSCARCYVTVGRRGEQIELGALFPERHPIPAELIRDLASRKAEIIEFLRYQEKADAVLLESTRRLAAAWPEGCCLDNPEWETYEKALHDVYWSADLIQLKKKLREREECALGLFDNYRNEAST